MEHMPGTSDVNAKAVSRFYDDDFTGPPRLLCQLPAPQGGGETTGGT